MKSLLKITPFIFAVLCFCGKSHAQHGSIYEKFAGIYITGHEWGGGSIVLNDDGTFSDGGGSDDGTSVKTSGKYALFDGKLLFTITKRTASRRDGKEFNLLDEKELREWSYGSSNAEVQKVFTLVPVEWSGRIYLIYEDDLKNFVNAINLGIEPRPWLTSDSVVSPWFGSFYLRTGDQKKKVAGKPSLPKYWLPFLLGRSLIATVISVQSVKKETWGTDSIVTINKGSKHGLKVGMRLVARNERPSQWEGSEIISVSPTRAQVKTTSNAPLKVGERIYSHYEPPAMLKRMRTLEMEMREKNENLK